MTAISLTIIAVFVPVSFMGGIAGRFFTEFGLTVSMAVLFSLLVALLLTPVLSAYLLKPTETDGEQEGILMRGYLAVLRRAIHHRYLTVLIGVAIFAGSIYVTRYLPSGFLPPEDTSRILMTIKLDDATSIDDTVEMAKKVDAIIRRDKDVREVFARGGGAGLGADIRTANLVIHLKPRGERNRSQAAISDSIEADLAKEQGIRFWTVNELSGLRDVLLAVVGSDGEKVAAAARDIEKQMSDIPEVKNVLANAAPEHKELRVRVKQDQVAASGVSRDAIFETIRLGTIGDIAAAIPVGDSSGEAIDVRLSLDAGGAGQADNFDSRLFQALFLDTKDGKRISVDKLADATVAEGPITLNRRDGNRVVTVEADLAEDVSLGNALAAIQELPAVKSMPPGVSLVEAGDAETMRETFVSFGIAMALGVAAVLIILIILFRSVMQPITILAVAAAVDRRRRLCAASLLEAARHAGDHRPADAGRHRHQERHHAGRLRHGGGAPRLWPGGGAHGCRPQTGPADRDDHHRHGGRHAPRGAGPWRGRRVPLAHGGRGDRRPRPLDAAVAALCSRHVYHHGRYWWIAAPPQIGFTNGFRGMQPITCALRLAFSGHARSGTGA